MTKIRAPVWASPRQFAVKAVGTTYYREALASLAQNKPGEASLCFFIAILFPDNANSHDSNAVAVMAQEEPGPPKVLGHLPRELAARYRERMETEGYPHHVSACGGALTGGIRDDAGEYNYVLELDLDLASVPHPDNEVSPAGLVRLQAVPPLKKDTDGAYRFTCWLPRDALGSYHPGRRAMGWTAPHWKTINYYLLNERGVGLGFKLLSVSKPSHAAIFGTELATPIIEAIHDRWVTLRLE